MKKVSILGLHLGIGGVENAIISLANALSDNFEVSIVVSYKVLDKPIFDIDKRVKVIYLSDLKPNKDEFKSAIKNKNIINIFKEGFRSIKILYLRKNLMKKYIINSNDDIIISTRVLFNGILGKYAKPNTIKIAQEHRYHNNDKKYIKSLYISVKQLDYFMPVSNYLTDFYKKEFKDLNVKVVHGRLSIDYLPKTYNVLNKKNIVAIGRLEKEKAFMDLIDVFNEIIKLDPEYHLDIVGNGSEYQNIYDKITKLDLHGKVKLHGFRDKPYIHKLLKNESIYVMTSTEESFGLVLIEAMAFGIPCIAFDSALGAKEIINNKNGILIKNRNKKDMAHKIVNLYNNKSKLQLMSIEARLTSNLYSYDSFKKFWVDFLDNISKGEK